MGCTRSSMTNSQIRINNQEIDDLSSHENSFQNNSPNSLFNIRSKYILNHILDHIFHLKVMEIIRYNKNIQKKLGIGINDYYNEFTKNIKIEIIPSQKYFGNFISDFPNIHIFFNDEIIEKKRNIIYEGEKVDKIRIDIEANDTSLKGLFKDCKSIEKINFIKFRKKEIIDMSYMFYGCTSLKEANLSNLITENVTDISFMFYNCPSIKELNLSNFNTKKVTKMKSIFSRCSSLEKIDLSNFDTQNVEDMSYMFFECYNLKDINLTKFNTKKVNNMSHMFQGCKSLFFLNIYNFDFKYDIDMQLMFFGCTSLQILFIKKFKARNIDLIFRGCSDELVSQFVDNELNKKEGDDDDCIIIYLFINSFIIFELYN